MWMDGYVIYLCAHGGGGSGDVDAGFEGHGGGG
jgi:hypothetical protein